MPPRQILGYIMGMTWIEGIVRGPGGEQDVTFLIDSGAMYSLLPEATWKALALLPEREMRFTLADGTAIVRQVSECEFFVSGARAHAPVVLGQPGDPDALLGVVTLENLGLVFDPFRRTLHPMRMLLAALK